MTIDAKTTRTVVHCPECQQPTQKVHSSYLRRPRDLPTAGLRVRLLLHTRKFFCVNTGCPRTIGNSDYHRSVTSAIIGPRKMEQLDDLLAGAGVVLDDEVLDRIDRIVPPGSDVGPLDAAYNPPAIVKADLRRRPTAERAAA